MAALQTGLETQTDEEFAAAAFRDELLRSTTARGRLSVQRIWDVCQELIASRKPITVAEVGRTTEKRWGSPKSQGIRDQPERLKRLVDLCGAVQRQSKSNGPGRLAKKGDKIDALVSEVADQTVRARIRAVVEERDQIRQDLRMLRGAYNRISPVGDLTFGQCYGEISASNTTNLESVAVAVPPPQQAFTIVEKDAVRKFLDEGFLYDEGLRIDETQGLVTSEGRNVLPKAFVTALRKILEA